MKWLALLAACSLLGTSAWAAPTQSRGGWYNLRQALWGRGTSPLFDRAFDPEKASTEVFYMAAPQPAVSCPSRSVAYTDIVPSAAALGTFYAPHTKIIASGQRCGTGLPSEYMWLVPGTLLADPTTAFNGNVTEAFKALQIYPRVRTTFEELSQVDLVYVGLELSSDRVCNGTVHWPRDSLFLFIGPELKQIDFSSYGFIYDGEKAMVGYQAMDPIPSACVYKTSLRAGPNMTALPTPSGSPPPAPSSSPNALEGLAVLPPSPADFTTPPPETTFIPDPVSAPEITTPTKASTSDPPTTEQVSDNGSGVFARQEESFGRAGADHSSYQRIVRNMRDGLASAESTSNHRSDGEAEYSNSVYEERRGLPDARR
jgi:hypothetical protein